MFCFLLKSETEMSLKRKILDESTKSTKKFKYSTLLDILNLDCLIEIAERLDQDDVHQFAMGCKVFYLVTKRALRKFITRRFSIFTSADKVRWALVHFPKYFTNMSRKLCKFAAKNNNNDLLKLIYEKGCAKEVNYAMHIIDKNGNIEMLKTCVNNGYKNIGLGGPTLAENNHLHILEWGSSINIQWYKYTLSKAALGGHLHIVQWCRKNGMPWDSNTCSYAAQNGHLEVLKWCRENGAPWGYCTCGNAAETGNLEMVKWCRENGAPWGHFPCSHAAKNGHLEVLKWCRENGAPWKKDTLICEGAASGGYFNILKWCYDHEAPLGNNICSEASKSNNLDIVKWCYAHGGQLTTGVCYYAASHGNLEILKWSREHGAPWNETICNISAKNGHLEVLKWCRENGCPWDKNILLRAFQYSEYYYDVLMYCRENDAPGYIYNWCKTAVICGDLELLKYCREVKGDPWNRQKICLLAAEHGHLNILDYCRKNGAHWSLKKVKEVAEKYGNYHVIDYCNAL